MKLGNTEILVIKGDITECDTQAIVNAANNKFLMGGGVAGAIKRKGGKQIEDEAVKKGPVEIGESVITGAGTLNTKYVIHCATMKMPAMPPACRQAGQAGIWETNQDIIRKAAYSALICAEENKISSIAFCALGCGVGGFSYEAASKIMAQEVFRYLREIKEPTLKKIVFVLYSQDAFSIFEKNVIDYLSYITKKINEGPFLTVDGIVEFKGSIIMIERSNPPLGWALPGGFVDYGESVEEAVIREIKEETSLDFVNIKEFKVCSAPNRDPRFHTVSIVFTGQGKGVLRAASDAKAAKVFSLDNLPKDIAFDHREIIEEYIKTR